MLISGYFTFIASNLGQATVIFILFLFIVGSVIYGINFLIKVNKLLIYLKKLIKPVNFKN